MFDQRDESEKVVNKYFDSSDFKQTKIVRWIISAIFVGFAFINGLSISSVLLIIAGLLIVPIKAPEYLLSKVTPLVALIVAVAIVLVGVLFSDDLFDRNKDNFVPGTGNNQTANNSSGSSGTTGGGLGNSSSGGGQNSGNADDSEDEEDNTDSSENDDNEQGSDTEGEDNPSNDSDNTNNGDPDYILNINSKKFHDPDCRFVDTMKEENKEEYYGTREDLIDDGYEPCKTCDP